MLVGALATSLATASQHVVDGDAREAKREQAHSVVLDVGAKRKLKRPSAAAHIARVTMRPLVGTAAPDTEPLR
jgi:hypothetical protein